MRKLCLVFLCAVTMTGLFAGDVASFVNLGFSSDGTRFVFGQYGVTDVDFQAYADIFCVDVPQNKFFTDGKKTIQPTRSTAGKDAKGVFASLQNDTAAYIKKLGVDSSNLGRTIYIQAVDEPKLKQISFRDFETGITYEVALKVLSEGSKENVKSSFYLTVEMVGLDGTKTVKTIGLPGFKREGINDYLIRRIITDSSGKSLVFIIEKSQFESNGNSIRFMVETLRL